MKSYIKINLPYAKKVSEVVKNCHMCEDRYIHSFIGFSMWFQLYSIMDIGLCPVPFCIHVVANLTKEDWSRKCWYSLILLLRLCLTFFNVTFDDNRVAPKEKSGPIFDLLLWYERNKYPEHARINTKFNVILKYVGTTFHLASILLYKTLICWSDSDRILFANRLPEF